MGTKTRMIHATLFKSLKSEDFRDLAETSALMEGNVVQIMANMFIVSVH